MFTVLTTRWILLAFWGSFKMSVGTTSFNSSRAIIIINGAVFGVVQSANWSINYGIKPIYQLDSLVTRELAPQSYSCSFDLSGVKVMASSFDESGIVSAPGTSLLQPYITFCLMDRLANIPLVNIEAGMISELSFQQGPKTYMTFNMSGVGIVALNDQSVQDRDNNPAIPPSLPKN